MNRVFSFLRGAVRGHFGSEDFSDKKFLIIGAQSSEDVELMFSIDAGRGAVLLKEPSLSLYVNLLKKGLEIEHSEQENIEIDLLANEIRLFKKSFPIGEIGEEPYSQGINEFYRK